MVRYSIVSPARNEEKFIERTIQSVISQTVKPIVWVIVDDGSSDKTPEIVQGYENKNPWIKLIRRKDRGYYSYGTGIIRAFNEGLKLIDISNIDYIVKLDCDLEFGNDYFEIIFNEFEIDETLGIAGGNQFIYLNGKLIEENIIKYFGPGPCKVYRKQTFQQIEGLLPIPGWDTMDAVRAWSFGWSTRVIDSCKLIHLKITGAKVNNHLDYGKTFYILGGHPIFILFRTIYRIPKSPVLVGSLIGLFSYLWYSLIKRPPKWPDALDRKRLRKFQIKRLLRKV